MKMGGLEGPPIPPTLRAPAEPWRSASVAVPCGAQKRPIPRTLRDRDRIKVVRRVRGARNEERRRRRTQSHTAQPRVNQKGATAPPGRPERLGGMGGHFVAPHLYNT